jgi:hypothetical protein
MWKILAAMDLMIAGVLIGQLFFDIPWRIVVALAGHLIVKAWLFWPEPLSIADGFIAIIAIIGLIVTFEPVHWGAVIVLAYKSIPAFISL